MKNSFRRLTKLILIFILAMTFACSGVVTAFATATYDGAVPRANITTNDSENKLTESDSWGSGDYSATEVSDTVSSKTAEYALSAKDTTDNSSSYYSKDDIVTVILDLRGEGLINQAAEYSDNTGDYFTTPVAKMETKAMLDRQQAVVQRYSSIIKEVVYNYTVNLNAVAVKVRYGDLEKFDNDVQITNVSICATYSKCEAEVTTNDVNVYSTGIYDSSMVSYKGAGTVVAILDTGLDYTHSAFQKQPEGEVALEKDDVLAKMDFFKATKLSQDKGVTISVDDVYHSKKVAYTYDYADIDANVYPSNDHGTHVAGIIAGEDESITGVATEAQLAIFKVFGDADEGAQTEWLLAALEDCVVLGVDVINMSLGSSSGFVVDSDEEINRVYNSINDAGICLICAASNDNSSAYQSTYGNNLLSNPDSATIGSPSTYIAAMSVASISGIKTQYFDVNGETSMYFTESSRSAGIKNSFFNDLLGDKETGKFEYVVVPGIGAAGNYSNIDVNGKIAVIKRGTSTFEEKVSQAKSHGAIGAIIYNNVSGTISMTIGKAKMPCCSISMDDGAYFKTHSEGYVILNKKNLAGPFMSDFSSWGCTPDLELKPDITAHGGDIYSAVRGGYDTLSGTSMACPNMAGATVLVREYVKENYPELSNKDIQEMVYRLMMSTATIARNEEGNPYSPRKQGAGLADILKAVTTPAYLYTEGQNKTKVSLGDDPNKTGEYTLKFNLENLKGTTLSYNVGAYVMSETVASDEITVAEKSHLFDDYEMTVSAKNATVNGTYVTIAGYQDAEITVKIKLSDADKKYLEVFPNGMFVEGYITFDSCDKDGINLNIPYLAFYGDWSVAPMLDVTAYEVGAEQIDNSILTEDKLKETVYATLPMAGFTYISVGKKDESYYGMGDFAYKYDETKYEKPAILEDKASITHNPDGSYSIAIISAGLLRNAKYTSWTIKNAVTGEIIKTGETWNSRKSHFSGSRVGGYMEIKFDLREYPNIPNNTMLTFDMECYLDWEWELDENGKFTANQDNLKNTFSFSFYIDDETPVLLDDRTQIRKVGSGNNARYYLDMYIYDNHYIQGYALGTYAGIDEDGELIDYKPFETYVIPFSDINCRGKINTVTYDITNYMYIINQNGGNMYIEIIDFAKNRSEYTFNIPKSAITEIKLTSDKKQNQTLKVNQSLDLTQFIETTPKKLLLDTITWTSDNNEIATVDQDGLVTALKTGETVITAKCQTPNADGEFSFVTFNIKVNDKTYSEEIGLFGISLNTNGATLVKGDVVELKATLNPVGTPDVELEWSVSENLKLEVIDNYNVKVTALESGSGSVLVSAKGSAISATCNIYVQTEFVTESIYLKQYNGRGDENGVVNVPSTLGIVYVQPMAFMNNPYIKKIVFPEGVTTIMYAGIYNNDALEEIVLPSTIETVERFSMAWNKSLKTVTGMEYIRSIPEYTFTGDESLENINLSKATYIGQLAFYLCESLKEIDLTLCRNAGYAAFANCTGLEKIKFGNSITVEDYAFNACKSLTSLEIPALNVGKAAFANCTGIENIIFTCDIDTVNEYAFYNCSALQTVAYYGTARVIGDYSFVACPLMTEAIIPNGCEVLGSLAFASVSSTVSSTSLSKVTFASGAKIKASGINAFYLCKNLKEFVVEDGNKYLSTKDGVLFDKSQTKLLLYPTGRTAKSYSVPNTVTEVGEYAFSYMTNLETLNLNRVTKIDDGAFYVSSIKSITFGTNLKYIGKEAFYACEFTSIPELPNSVEYIGESAFAEMEKATGSVVLPANLKTLGKNAFYNDLKISSVTIRSQLTEIPDGAFYNCRALTKITIGDGVERIGRNAFYYCMKLNNVVLGDNVKEIGDGAFSYCVALSNLTLGQGLTKIGNSAFYYDYALQNLTLPESLLEIGNKAFTYTAVKNIDLKNVETVGDYAFYAINMKASDGNTGIESITAEKLVKVGECAFASYYSSSIQVIYGNRFTELDLPNVETVGRLAFAYNINLESVSLPKATVLGEGALYYCKELTTTDIKEVVEIGNACFAYCEKLGAINTPELETIGQEVFTKSGIVDYEIPATVKNIAAKAFYYAEGITKLSVEQGNELYFADENGVLYKNLPNKLLELVAYPTSSNLTKYETLENTVRVEAYAFANVGAIEEIVLGSRVKNIGESAFVDSDKLTKITLKTPKAPTLESWYSSEIELNVAYKYEDGYTLELLYKNFGDVDNTVTVYYPSNGVGYDTYGWTVALGDRLIRSEEYCITEGVYNVIDGVNALPDVENITIDNVKTVTLLYKAYNALSAKELEFLGEYDGIIEKLLACYQKIQQFTNVSNNQNIKMVNTLDIGRASNNNVIIITSTIVMVLLIITIGIVTIVAKKQKENK